MAGKKKIKTIEPKQPKKMGAPRIFNSKEELLDTAIGYFDSCTASRTMPNKAGLSIWLGISRDTLNRYEKMEDLSDATKVIYAWIEDAWTQRLAGANATGTIFYLKNTFGWVDKHETDMTSGGKAIQFTIPQEIATKHSLVFIDTDAKQNKNNIPIEPAEVPTAAIEQMDEEA